MDLIQQLEQEEISRLGKSIPEFAPGDTEDKLYALLRDIVTRVKAQGAGGAAR